MPDRQKILVEGQWIESRGSQVFKAVNPLSCQEEGDSFPVSTMDDWEVVVQAAAQAHEALQLLDGSQMADFLEAFAIEIEGLADELVEMAHRETALPLDPRLKSIELPRTTNQLRLAAQAARDESWRDPVIDRENNIRSCRGSLGPVFIMGPNNFPFAFNAVSGGDAAAALAAGNPVIAKAHPSHPGTTQLLAEAARRAIESTQVPTGTLQMIYHLDHEDGFKTLEDRRLGAFAYTGSRQAGLTLKARADVVGLPVYLELSSLNPVLILPGALTERGDKIAEELAASVQMGTGQFCTCPNLVFVVDGEKSELFKQKLSSSLGGDGGTLLSGGISQQFADNLELLIRSGATLIETGSRPGEGFSQPNTLLTVEGTTFLNQINNFQTEVFGNATCLVFVENQNQLSEILMQLEGNLTGCLYTDTQGSDDDLYNQLEPLLRRKVGRLINDKMPTGVAVSPAMNHGGPFPATGHPGFSAVGLPGSIRRFTALHSYDNVRSHRLPTCLRDSSAESANG